MSHTTSQSKNHLKKISNENSYPNKKDEPAIELLETYQSFLNCMERLQKTLKLGFIHLSKANNEMQHRIGPVYYDLRMKAIITLNNEQQLETNSTELEKRNPNTWFGQPISSNLLVSQSHFKEALSILLELFSLKHRLP